MIVVVARMITNVAGSVITVPACMIAVTAMCVIAASNEITI